MSPDDILAHPSRVLSQVQRECYFREGCLAAEAVIPQSWIDRLLKASRALVERSRALTASDSEFDLGPKHCADSPHVRRLKALVDRDPVFWEFASESMLADVAAVHLLVGRCVRLDAPTVANLAHR